VLTLRNYQSQKIRASTTATARVPAYAPHAIAGFTGALRSNFFSCAAAFFASAMKLYPPSFHSGFNEVSNFIDIKNEAIFITGYFILPRFCHVVNTFCKKILRFCHNLSKYATFLTNSPN
jgi:hypothetical protein